MMRIAIAWVLLIAARSASADATITLKGEPPGSYGWQLENASLTVAGRVLLGSEKATMKVPASKQLVEATWRSTASRPMRSGSSSATGTAT